MKNVENGGDCIKVAAEGLSMDVFSSSIVAQKLITNNQLRILQPLFAHQTKEESQGKRS